MPVPQYMVGSAAADTLSRLGSLQRLSVQYRTVDLIKIARFNADEAQELLLTDAVTARDFLLTGASRMIRAAEQLEAQMQPRANVAPLRAVR